MIKNLENKANNTRKLFSKGVSLSSPICYWVSNSMVIFCFFRNGSKKSASIEDILLLFIYLELGAIVGIYFKTNHMPVRFLIYVAITALTRMLLEYLNNWHSLGEGGFHYDVLIIICGGIVLLAISILVLRYSSYNYPSDKNKIKICSIFVLVIFLVNMYYFMHG